MKSTIQFALLAAAALLLAAKPAGADQAMSLLFETAHMETAKGAPLRYRLQRKSAFEDRLGESVDQTVLLEPGAGGGVYAVILDADGARPRRLEGFTGPNNPIFLVFLENVKKSVSTATGGSPFYIKNRIQDAFRAGAAELKGDPGESAFAYKPFAVDANRARLGPFAELELRFSMARAARGMFLRLAASAADDKGETVYEETLELVEPH